jgi:SAM-dependent methyltransferase
MKETQTDWEAAYRCGDTPWEKGAAHPALVDFLKANGRIAGKVLVPGCGSGHDVRALSNPDNQVVGIDLAPAAIERATAFPQVAGEEYHLADLFALPASWNRSFDVVFEHTCFCAITPAMRERYVEAISRLLKPGGQFLAIFFLNPDHAEDGPPHGVSREELDKFFGSCFTLECEWVPARTHSGREERELVRLLKRNAEPLSSPNA